MEYVQYVCMHVCMYGRKEKKSISTYTCLLVVINRCMYVCVVYLSVATNSRPLPPGATAR